MPVAPERTYDQFSDVFGDGRGRPVAPATSKASGMSVLSVVGTDPGSFLFYNPVGRLAACWLAMERASRGQESLYVTSAASEIGPMQRRVLGLTSDQMMPAEVSFDAAVGVTAKVELAQACAARGRRGLYIFEFGESSNVTQSEARALLTAVPLDAQVVLICKLGTSDLPDLFTKSCTFDPAGELGRWLTRRCAL